MPPAAAGTARSLAPAATPRCPCDTSTPHTMRRPAQSPAAAANATIALGRRLAGEPACNEWLPCLAPAPAWRTTSRYASCTRGARRDMIAGRVGQRLLGHQEQHQQDEQHCA